MVSKFTVKDKKQKPFGIYLLAGALLASNLLLFFWNYVASEGIRQKTPLILKTIIPILAVFPQQLFEGYMRDFVEMRLFWIVTMLACAVGIFCLSKMARSAFIVLNIIHIVALTYLVAMKLGQPEFFDYFFKLYFNMVAALTYVGFLTILEIRELFNIITKESFLSLWLKKFHAASQGATTPDAYYNLGLAYSRLERYDDAVDQLKKAVGIDPDQADVHFQLGLIYMKQNRYHEAINSFKEVIRLDPFHTDAHLSIGMAYKKEGCTQESIRAFEKASRGKPDNAEVYRNLGEAYSSVGKYKEAVGAFKEAARLNPQEEGVHYQLGTIYLHQLEQFHEAKEALQKAVHHNPQNAAAYFELGMVSVKLNLPKDAIRAFKEVIRIEPDHKQGHYQLGFSYATIGDAVSSQREYQQLKELDPDLAENLKMYIIGQ